MSSSTSVSQLKSGSWRVWHWLTCAVLCLYILMFALIPVLTISCRSGGWQPVANLTQSLHTNPFAAAILTIESRSAALDQARIPQTISPLSGQTLSKKIFSETTLDKSGIFAKIVLSGASALAGYLLLLAGCTMLLIGSAKSVLERVACLVALLASFPAQQAIRNGSDSTILLPLVAIFWLLLRKQKLVAAAACAAAVGVMRFEYLPFALLPGLLVGGRRFLVSITGCYAVMAAAYLTICGAESFSSLPRALSLADSFQSFEISRMDNVFGLLAALYPNCQLGACCALLVLGAALLFLIYIWGVWYPNNKSTDNAFQLCGAATTLLMPFTSMITPLADYVLYFIPCCWILDWLKSNAMEPRETLGFRLFIMSVPAMSWLEQSDAVLDHMPTAKLLTICGLIIVARISRDLLTLRDKALAKHLRGTDYNLGALLVAADLVDEERVKAAAEFSRIAGVNLGQALILTGCISRQVLEEATLSQHLLKNKKLPVSKLRSTLHKLKALPGG